METSHVVMLAIIGVIIITGLAVSLITLVLTGIHGQTPQWPAALNVITGGAPELPPLVPEQMPSPALDAITDQAAQPAASTAITDQAAQPPAETPR
ncbi:hypothetical protein [Streptosporangium fragile]